MLPFLSQDQIEAISKALGHTEEGLTNVEIDSFMATCRIENYDEISTKWKRLNHCFWNQQVRDGNSLKIEKFICVAMSPARYIRTESRYEVVRLNLNKALSFVGYYIDVAGNICSAEQKSKTISEAEKRAEMLRSGLSLRGVHGRVLYYCKAELLVDDYFHATQEAVKGVFDRLRELSGDKDDGHRLVDGVLSKGGYEYPKIVVNNYITESEQSEQAGFANILKGLYGMFRNTTAHEVRVKWPMPKEDAEDLLSIVSLIHRRLDRAHVVRAEG